MKLLWHGDVDFGTADLQSTYKGYLSRLESIDTLKSNLHSTGGKAAILKSLNEEQELMTSDIAFITDGRLHEIQLLCTIALFFFSSELR